MDSVKEMLDTELGIKKIHPSIVDYPSKQDPLTNYNPGTGENGAVFCHANTWAIIAECMLGRGDNAYKYYRQLIPNVAMEKAGIWRYKAEPYVYVSNIFGPESDKFGMANVSWLTGTAAWMYIAVTQYILGIKATWEGLQIDPCVPSDWKEFSIVREFRGTKYNISFKNESGTNKGIKKITVDGKEISTNVIPYTKQANLVNVEVTM
jgi:cellobiose phosphorylase